MQDPQSLHKYLYVHGDPVQGIDPTGQFSLGGALVSIGIGLGNVATELTSGAVIMTAIETGGRAGFGAREAGLLLIAGGDYRHGFMLYNLGNRIVKLTFDVIDAADTAIGGAALVTALSLGVIAVIKNADDIVDGVATAGRKAQQLFDFAKTFSKRFKGPAFAGTVGAAETLASRATQIQSLVVPGFDAGTTVVARARKGGAEKVFVARQGTKRVNDDFLNPGEEFLSGRAGNHAEENLMEGLPDGWVLVEGGTSRNICNRKGCGAMLESNGLTVGGTTYNPSSSGDGAIYRAFWREGT